MTDQDTIEDIELDVDVNGITLVLQGDFVATFQSYLDNPDAMGIGLHLSSTLVRSLRDQLNELTI